MGYVGAPLGAGTARHTPSRRARNSTDGTNGPWRAPISAITSSTGASRWRKIDGIHVGRL